MTATELRPAPRTGSHHEPVRPGVDRPDERSSPEDSWAVEAALWVLVGTTLLDFHRCFRGWGADWMGPVFVTGFGVLAVCRLTRRHVGSPLIGSLIDMAALVLLTVWTVVPSSTTVGIPTGATVRAINAALEQVVPRFAGTSPPVPATTGFLVLAVAGTGAVALLSSWLTLRIGRPLIGAVPAFAGYVVCGSIGTRSGRIWSTLLFVLAIGGFLLVTRAARPRPPGVLLGPAPTDLGRGQLGGGLAIVAAATAAATIVAASAAGADGHGPLGWNSIQQSNTRIVISPLVTLRTRLLTESGRDVFTVTSTQPSYWRITSLNNFDGGTWNAQDKYSGVDGPLPGITRPRGTRQVTERFDIQDLDEPWAPLAFDPETVTGAGHVSYDPRSGSLLTPHPSSNGLRYTVRSVQYLATLSGAKLAQAPALHRGSAPAGSLQLPTSTIPERVVRLAHRLVRGKRTEYAKALALQQFFHTSTFTYSLDPPADGSGITALSEFLFVTHEGYCQQFAGSYAVLARLDGLPTRLAVGFTTGRQTGAHTYQVTDADAHTWPEVWFPKYGWVPFEPTKGAPGHGYAIPGATHYTGNTAATAPRKTSRRTTGPRTTTPPSTAPSQPGKASQSTTPTVPGRSAPNPHVVAPHQGEEAGPQGVVSNVPAQPGRTKHPDVGLLVLEALAAAAIAAALLGLSNLAARRYRWWRRRRVARQPGGEAGGAAMTLAAWSEVEEALAWHGIVRRPSETLGELVGRAASCPEFDRRGPGHGHPAEELRRLAQLATVATFARAVPLDEAAEADTDAADIRRTLKLYLTPGQRLALFFDPRLAWLGPAASADAPCRGAPAVPTNPWAARH